MNPDPCGGVENESDGCGVIFPRMPLDTIHCPLCKKLKAPNLSREALATLQVSPTLCACLSMNIEHFEQETLHQCMECGLCGTMLKSPCGTCKRKGEMFINYPMITVMSFTVTDKVFSIAHDENDTLDTASLASQNSRRRQLVDRLHRPAGSPAVGPTTPLSELVNLRANAGSFSHFTIFIEVRRSSAPNSIDKILGKTCVPYPESTTFLGKPLLSVFA